MVDPGTKEDKLERQVGGPYQAMDRARLMINK